MLYTYCKRRRVPIKAAVFLFLCIFALIPYGPDLFFAKPATEKIDLETRDLSIRAHVANVENFYGLRLVWASSRLGGIMFNREPIPVPNRNENKTFVVLVWKFWDWLKRRHVYNFGRPQEHTEDNYLKGCSVQNCKFSGDDSLLNTADAVLIHLQKGMIPEVQNRNRKQKWIFLTDEAPFNTFSLAKSKTSLDRFYNVFNWSMTYRSDADIPVPYGRTVAREFPKLTALAMPELAAMVPNWNRKRWDVPVALLMSNCAVKARNKFLEELRKHIPVDVYGACATTKEYKKSCPGHFQKDCDPIASYLFYLVLENSSCFQYLTEKVFYHAYEKGAIPIIYGPALEDVETLLPPNSYLFADKSTDIDNLANTIRVLAESSDMILAMHMWRSTFEVINEHGYFGTKSYHLCRVCEALNYNDDLESVYDQERLDNFLDPSKACYNTFKDEGADANRRVLNLS